MTDELFFAWLDGELGPEDSAKVASVVAADPALSRKAEAHRAMGARLRSAFDPILETRMPERVGGATIDFAAAKESRDQRRRGSSAIPQWAALAATLVLGIGLGSVATTGRDDSPIGVEQGRLVASAELESALYSRLASAPSDTGPRIGLTFRDRSGALCRSFTDLGASGLACYEQGDWRVRGLFQGSGAQGDYRMAAGTDPRLAAMIDETIAGEPLDAKAERAALEQGFR